MRQADIGQAVLKVGGGVEDSNICRVRERTNSVRSQVRRNR